MSNIDLIIEERPRNIGNFMVGRLLPFKDKRMVGPFIFIDHMGPAEMSADESLNIGPHPHIGLSTLTYLFEGRVRHKDSLGTELEIRPGQVNWMTAGKGIAHSERSPEALRGQPKKLHGLQIWVALPKALEQMEPEFFHAEETELPVWTVDAINYKLIAGEFMGHRSPVPVYSPLCFLELKAAEHKEVSIGQHLNGELGIYILEGSLEAEGHVFGPRELLVSGDPSSCSFVLAAGTTIYFFGGDPFPEERHIYWNFVSSDYSLIEQAKQQWTNGGFPEVPDEHDPIPLPDENSHLKARH